METVHPQTPQVETTTIADAPSEVDLQNAARIQSIRDMIDVKVFLGISSNQPRYDTAGSGMPRWPSASLDSEALEVPEGDVLGSVLVNLATGEIKYTPTNPTVRQKVRVNQDTGTLEFTEFLNADQDTFHPLT
jgi:hypothetical protein